MKISLTRAVALYAALSCGVQAIDNCTPAPIKDGFPVLTIQGKVAVLGADDQITNFSHLINNIDSSQFYIYHKGEKVVSDVITWKSNRDGDGALQYVGLVDGLNRPTTIEMSCSNQGSSKVVYKVQTMYGTDNPDAPPLYHIDWFFGGGQGRKCSIPFYGGIFPDQIHGYEYVPAHSRPPIN